MGNTRRAEAFSTIERVEGLRVAPRDGGLRVMSPLATMTSSTSTSGTSRESVSSSSPNRRNVSPSCCTRRACSASRGLIIERLCDGPCGAGWWSISLASTMPAGTESLRDAAAWKQRRVAYSAASREETLALDGNTPGDECSSSAADSAMSWSVEVWCLVPCGEGGGEVGEASRFALGAGDVASRGRFPGSEDGGRGLRNPGRIPGGGESEDDGGGGERRRVGPNDRVRDGLDEGATLSGVAWIGGGRLDEEGGAAVAVVVVVVGGGGLDVDAG
jgi:hypothetical protein